MRRILALLTVVLLLAGAYSCAAASPSAYDLALQMAQSIPEMTDIRQAPLQAAPDRAIWTDARTDARCDLTIYESTAEAERAAVREGTPFTVVRIVENCLLGIDSDLSMKIIDAYQQRLADVLGAGAEGGEPDYILNVNTKRFHNPACSSVTDIKETNRQSYSGERDYLIEQGYDACKKCKP